MSNRFMISVAALALVAGTGLANAQGTMKNDGGGAGAQPAQQTQPSGGAAEHGTMGKDSMTKEKGTVGQSGGASTMKPGAAAEEKSPGAMKDEHSGGAMNKNAAEDKAGAPKGQRTDERAQGQMDKGQDKSKSTMDKSQMDKSKSTETDTKSGNVNAQTKGAETKSQTTTGNAATSANAAPPAEKRTQIVSAIKSQKIEETTNVNFNISVGTTVPSTVRFHPLPPQIVEIYPEWRGYDVIFVHGQYLIVRPQTHEIVYIIEG